jgi:hypothetical protein
MGGTACNGLRFWTVEGQATAKAEKPAKREAQPKVHVEKAPKAKAERKPRAAKAFKLFDKVEAKDGDPEGSIRFWCHGC